MSTPVTDALDFQGRIKPGTLGWWKVWGATASDILPGDLIMVKPKDGEITEHRVMTVIAETGMLSAMYVRFTDADGEDLRIGRLISVIVLRKGTHHMLADSI